MLSIEFPSRNAVATYFVFIIIKYAKHAPAVLKVNQAQ